MTRHSLINLSQTVAGAHFEKTRTPPANMVDTIIVHLQDSYVIVHRAAMQAERRRPSWFNEAQAIEVITTLPAYLQTYGDRPYQLDDIGQSRYRVGTSIIGRMNFQRVPSRVVGPGSINETRSV